METRQIWLLSYLCLLLTIFFSPSIPKVHAPNRFVLSFDGTDDYVNCGNDSSLNFERTDEFSIVVWLRITDIATTRAPFSREDRNQPVEAGFRGYSMSLVYDSTPDEAYIMGDLISNWQAGDRMQVNGTTNVNDDQWHHAVITYDGSSQASGMNIYVDGNLDTMIVVHNNLTATTQLDANATIGTAQNWPFYYNGAMDEICVYDREITSTEITYSYGSERGVDSPLNQTGLVAWWKFNTGSGNTAYDETANNNDGTIYGATWVQGGVVFPQTASEILIDAAVVGAQLFSITLVLAVIYVIGATNLTYKERILFILASIMILILILVFASMPMMDVGR